MFTKSMFLKEFNMFALAQKPSSSTQSVVSNDMQITSKNAIDAEPNKPKTLDEMEAARKQWQTTAFRTSNQQLYGVLADCLAYGAALEIGAAKARSKALQAFLELRKYVVKKDSPLMTRIVKSVFGEVDRRRVSTYSLVLREAQRQGVQSSLNGLRSEVAYKRCGSVRALPTSVQSRRLNWHARRWQQCQILLSLRLRN
jgi:hypothetical protein